MSPEPALLEHPEVQDDPSSSSPSQPQENASQSPAAVQAGTSTATGHAARCVILGWAFVLYPAFLHIRLCSYCTGFVATVAQLPSPIGSPEVCAHVCYVASCQSLQCVHMFAMWPHVRVCKWFETLRKCAV